MAYTLERDHQNIEPARSSKLCPTRPVGLFGALRFEHLPIGMKKARNVARLTSRADPDIA